MRYGEKIRACGSPPSPKSTAPGLAEPRCGGRGYTRPGITDRGMESGRAGRATDPQGRRVLSEDETFEVASHGSISGAMSEPSPHYT
jgi:hypothetical protein